MKTLVSLLFVSLISFSSCKKDDEPTTSEKLQYSWTLNNIIYRDLTVTPPTSVTINGNTGDYIDFRANGQAIVRFQGQTDTSNYSILNDSYLLIDGDSARINTLNNTTLQLVTRDRDATLGYDDEYTFNLSR